MVKKIIFTFLVLLFLYNCSRQQRQNESIIYNPRVIETTGYFLPRDSLSPPISVAEGKPNKILAGKPKVIKTNTNIHIAGVPKIILAGEPKVMIPGQDKCGLPTPKQVIERSILAGMPEVILAKDPYIKDQNPHNFSSFSKLQGLKHDLVRCMIQDKNGNLWFGTDGGATKYDGKNFIHYTEKEGLSSNIILSMVEDKTGNIWFGTNGGGITRYDGKYFTQYNTKDGLSNNYILSIYEDKSGYIWFGTLGGGVLKYDGNLVEAIERGEKIALLDQKQLKRLNGKYVKSFTSFTQKEGLIQNNVYCILQDNIGNIWFGTNGGICKYGFDPNSGLKSFIHYRNNEGLFNNLVRSIFQDREGYIWFGTEGGGVLKFNGTLVETIESGDKSLLSDSPDLKKTDSKFVKYFAHYSDKEGLSNNKVNSILQDEAGNIWFGTYGGGISKLELKHSGTSGAGQTTFTHFTVEEGLSNNRIFCIFRDRSGNLWFGTDGGGVSKYDGNLFNFFTEKEGLLNSRVIGLIQDKKGNLWFGTYGGGVAMYDGKSFTHYTEKEGLCDSKVISMLQDKEGNFWFGTYNGGVSKFDGKYFTNYTEKEGLSNNCVYCIFQDQAGNLWFGTEGGASKYDGNLIESIERGERNGQNNLQYLKRKNGKPVKTFTHYKAKQGLINSGVYCIFQDKIGNLWFGTDLLGLTKFDGKSFIRFTENNGLNNNYVVSLLQDKDENLWIGTIGGGVTKLSYNKTGNPTNYIFTHFTEKEDLSNNSVFSILEDKYDNLWFGTRFGLNKLSQKNLTEFYSNSKNKIFENSELNNDHQPVLFKNYTYEDGFLGLGCNRSAMLEDKNGTIWIGANEKLTAYYPKGDKADSIPPNIQITNVELFNENMPWIELEKKSDTTIILGNGVAINDFSFDEISKWYGLPHNLSLKYNNNFLSFKFIGITQKQSKKVKYQYKLEGLDNNWSSTTYRNEASYSNLPDGQYIFKVKAMNSEGIWSDVKMYSFSIRAPWWKTWWFNFITAIFILLCLVGIYRWRIATLRNQKKKLEKKVDERTHEVFLQKEELEKINKELKQSNYELKIQRKEMETLNEELASASFESNNRRNELEVALHSLKETQIQLIQSEKMASLGVLAAGVAHEINNPLNFIQSGIDGIETYFNVQSKNCDEEISALINAIKVGVERAASIVTSLNHYSRQDNEKKMKCNIHVIIDNCLVMLNNQIKNRIIIVKNYSGQSLTLTGNESKLHQAMLNVLANAVQAIEKEGTIIISTQLEVEVIKIIIEDSGSGINKQDLHKIFDPFFTTKDPGKGTGLGLSITYSIVKEHNGSIEFESQIGVGTKVLIKLPVKVEEA